MSPSKRDLDATRKALRQRRSRECYERFVPALAEFLAGTNQARMSVALSMPSGELKAVAELWRDLRVSVPGLMGYLTADEAAAEIRDFLIEVFTE